MTEPGFSPDKSVNVDQTGYREDSSPSDKKWLDMDMSDFTFSGNVVYKDETPRSQLGRIASRLVSNQSGEQSPLVVPLLGYLVPDAESCVLFYTGSIKNKLYPAAIANLSEEFARFLAEENSAHLLTAAKQAEPYLIINLPDNREFRDLSKSFHGEAIKSLCLVPLHEANGSVFGILLFISKRSLETNGEDMVSVTLFTEWISAMLYQFNNQRQTGLRMYKDKHGIPVTYDAATHEQRKHAKSDAISVLSHELLSPLTLIKGYTATMLQLSDAITEEQKEQYLQGIDSASNRVIRLLENLRDITHLEETDALVAEPVYLSDLLRATVSEMQSQTTKHIIKLCPSARLPRIRVDPEKIDQVISNLLINAVKYSPKGGDIEAEISLVRSEQELRKMFGDAPALKLPCLVVSIADSGIGIPEAELDQIFEKFYRVSTELTRSTPGAGLGLYICKIIVEAHGGQIWARNRLQGGSIFCFSLPVELPK